MKFGMISIIILAAFNALSVQAATQTFRCETDRSGMHAMAFELRTSNEHGANTQQLKGFSQGSITLLKNIPNVGNFTGNLGFRDARYIPSETGIEYKSVMLGSDVFTILLNPTWLGKEMACKANDCITVHLIHESYNNQEDEGTFLMYCSAHVSQQ